jgi:hypothetical protein
MSVRRPLAVLAAVAALAAWLDFSRLHQSHHADSLVPVLAGLTAWTPFYWGQDRFGMLVPLLTLPIRSPGAHLLTHGFLVLALSVWSLILLVRVLLPRHLAWAPPLAVLLALLFLLAPADQRFNILWVQPYSVSFALGLVALGLLQRRGALRVGAAAALFLAGAWVNIGMAVVVGPLALWRALFVDTDRSGLARLRFAALALGLQLLATLVSLRLSQAMPLPHTPSELLPVAVWPEGAATLLRGAWVDPAVRAWVSCALALAALGLCSLVSARVRAAAAPVLVAAAGLACTAYIPFAVVMASKWVMQNGYPLRYLDPSLVLLQAACALLATLPVLALPVRRFVLAAASVWTVALSTLIAVGPPSYRVVRDAFESRWGASARDVIAARATHVTGNYWNVWPTVFYADWLLGTQDRRHWPYGITDRSDATLERALAVPRPRVAALEGSGRWIGLLGPHAWLEVERRPTCLVVTPR